MGKSLRGPMKHSTDGIPPFEGGFWRQEGFCCFREIFMSGPPFLKLEIYYSGEAPFSQVVPFPEVGIA